jgi:uncharacterized metal-binding protein
MPSDCIFTLPLEIDTRNFINSEEETLLTVESDGYQKSVKYQGQIDNAVVKRRSACGKLLFLMNIIKWHVLAFFIITGSFFAIFEICLSQKDKKEVLNALSFFSDWKQLVFFFGIYLSYSVKKVGDVSAVSNRKSVAKHFHLQFFFAVYTFD